MRILNSHTQVERLVADKVRVTLAYGTISIFVAHVLVLV
jgi:hypothetical protein